MQYISAPLGYVLKFCYDIVSNYGLALVLFTLCTKVILLPLSVWNQKNSVKMVEIQPELNRLKAKFFGDNDSLADEQLKLYKREKYNPMLGMIPMAIQIFFLLCLINIVYNPLTHLLHLDPTLIATLTDLTIGLTGADPESSSVQIAIVSAIQSGQFNDSFLAASGMTSGIFSAINDINMSFAIFNLAEIPLKVWGTATLMPLLAGGSALALGLSQNKLNPLQAEQGKFGQLGTTALSVGISLLLGGAVPAGVGLYWIFSNVFSIFQQFLLNVIINPKKHIDYKALEESKAALAEIEALDSHKNESSDEERKREKADYKRFFSVANKHLVFYSESNGFYKYFESTINSLLKKSNVVIHYITSDINDKIFELAETEPHIKPYYIGSKKLITLLMKMDADMVVMTMPDIENYHYKRSYVKKNIEYVYMFHYPLSTHMVLHTGALDHYDTVLCVGEFQFDEIRKTEEIYGLPEKKLIACGYSQLEKLQASYDAMEKSERSAKKILIAPSWQADNILDSCIDGVLSALLGKGFEVVVRPHPEYMKRYKERMELIVQRYSDYKGSDLSFELDFTSNNSIFDSDVVLTDWSGTAFEFSFVTLKPAVFINTPPKINNPEYTKLGIEPLEFSLRDKVGISVDPDKLESLAKRISELIGSKEKYSDDILALRTKYIANYGKSGDKAADYILHSLQEKRSAKK